MVWAMHRQLRSLVAWLLVPLMALLLTVTPRTAHACGGEAGMDDCPCTVVDAEVPQARRRPCCEPEPDAAPTPAADLDGRAPSIDALVPAPQPTTVPALRPVAVLAHEAWPRGPPRSVPLLLRHCSLLR